MGHAFRIKLNNAHRKSGLSYYMAAKRSGLALNTVNKYAKKEVESTYIPAAVVILAALYGVDWRDPEIVEVIEVEEGESTPRIENTLLTA